MVRLCRRRHRSRRHPAGAEALRVFLDCDRCDDDYLRTELTFVNYVPRPPRRAGTRARHARVHGQRRPSHDVRLRGPRRIRRPLDDQLTYFSSQDDTDDAERRGVAQTLRLGLVRYAAGTPLGLELNISHIRANGQVPVNAQPEDDPWNFWVFRTRVNVRVEGEEKETSKSLRRVVLGEPDYGPVEGESGTGMSTTTRIRSS